MSSLQLASASEELIALERVFRRLPSPPERILYAAAIPGIARDLLLMRPIARRVAPFGQGLDRAAAAAQQTVEAIEQLSFDAMKALNLRPGVLGRLTMSLRIFTVAARHASDGGGKAGRPAKVQKLKIARAVGEHYLRLNGRRPTVFTSTDDGEAGG